MVLRRATFWPILAALWLMLGARGASAAVVEWTARLEPKDVRAGEAAQVVLEAKVEPEWHLYSLTKRTGMGPLVTTITLPTSPALTTQGEPVQPPPHREMDKGFKIEVEYYAEGVAFGLPVQIAPGVSGEQKATVAVRFQACREGTCLAPKTKELPFTFTVSPGPARADRTAALTEPPQQPSGYTPPAAGEGGSTPPPPAAGTTATAVPDTEVARSIASAKAGGIGGLLSFLGFAISAGFLALLTPCVFPMIPITVSFFSKKGDADDTESGKSQLNIGGATAYCLGIIGTFTGLGLLVTAVFGATGVQTLATNPFVNLGLALLFIVLAVNLFGGFEIMLPSWLLEKAQSGAGKGGFLGPMMMGLCFTLTSFTCTVAFVGGLLAATAGGEWFWPLLGMLAFSTAFASPFFLLALFPQWLARMPQSGSWLVTVKAFMGFLELAAALKFLSNVDLAWRLGLLTRPVFLAIWFTIAVVAAAYLVGLLRLPHDMGGKIGFGRMAVALGTLGAAYMCLGGINGKPLGTMSAFLPPQPYPGQAHTGEGVKWVTDYEAARKQAAAEGKPLFLNFTGIYCTNCRDMEDNVFKRPEVAAELDKFVTVELYTDTDTPQARQYQELQLKRFGQTTLPLYVIETADGKKIGESPWNTNVPKFMDFLQKGREQAATTPSGSPEAVLTSSTSEAPTSAAADTSAEGTPPAQKGPVKWSARLEPADVRAGEAAEVVLAAKIDAPWHIYSLTPTKGMGPAPTQVVLISSPDLTANGAAKQPEPKREIDKGFKVEVELFAGSVEFRLPVKVAGASGERKAGAKVRFQACNEGSCLPPKTVELPVTYTVADGPARPERVQVVSAH
jgi:thiol:disulfide interchange protein DsbD